MKMHKFILFTLSLMLLLSGCAKKETEDENNLILKPVISGEFGYILPFESNDTRYVHNSYQSSKSDPLSMGYGALQLAKKYFNPEKVLVREGQIVSSKELEATDNLARGVGLLKYKSEYNAEGLNPEKGIAISNGEDVEMYNPILVSDVYEIDYMSMDGKESVGFTFVIVLNSNVTYWESEKDEEGNTKVDSEGNVILKPGAKTTTVTKDQLFTYGSVEAGQRLINYLRNNHPEVGNLPIHVALYQAPPIDSKTSGSFIGEALVNDRSASYTPLNQEWVFMPSDRLNGLNGVIGSQFNMIRASLFENFPIDVGIFGRVFFENDAAKRIEMEVNLQAKTYVEIQSLIQYLVELCANFADTSISIKVDVKSDDETIAILKRSTGNSTFEITMN